jgi:hypothetical protein
MYVYLPVHLDPAGDPAPGHCHERAEEAGRAERLPGLCHPGRTRLLLRPRAGGLNNMSRQALRFFLAPKDFSCLY